MAQTVVITGSTRGIGFGMAQSFLARGCSVMINGRDGETTDQSVAALHDQFTAAEVSGYACDVREFKQVESLWRESIARFGHVDIWINNAGITGDQQLISKIPPSQVEDIITTNILGLIYGSQVASRGMLAQGFGSIYNMEGMGSDGRSHQGLTFYGTTKYAVCYFTKDLAKEMVGTPIIVGALRPGMVVTDLITKPYEGRPEEWKRVKRIFNIIADPVEVVAPWLVDQVLKNKRNGVHLTHSSALRMFFRFLAQPIVHRELFKEETSV